MDVAEERREDVCSRRAAAHVLTVRGAQRRLYRQIRVPDKHV